MYKSTYEALQASIEHWIRLYTGKRRDGERAGSEDCPLCKRFTCGKCQRDDGELCPVREQTGFTSCDGSPYESLASVPSHLNDAGFRVLAYKELKFLEGLMPFPEDIEDDPPPLPGELWSDDYIYYTDKTPDEIQVNALEYAKKKLLDAGRPIGSRQIENIIAELMQRD